jgi:LmbE family N-acetylglucosaminyl deacetylase
VSGRTPDPQPLPPGAATRLAPASTLVLAPHFDDEVLGCGGLLAAQAKAGAEVRVLFLTDGSGGIEAIENRPAYASRRAREAAAAVKELGVTGFEVVAIPDGELDERLDEAAAAIRRAIDAQRPARILVPSPLEVTADHRAAFAALHLCLTGVRDGDELAPAVRGLEVLVYEVNHPGYPDLLVDVSGELATIERAMARYSSQEERHPYLRSALGLRQFRTHTLAPSVAAAEGYRRLELADFTTRGLAALTAHLGGAAAPVVPGDGPLISVIVRTRDRPRLLADALASLYASTYRRLEIVLVNDGGARPEIAEPAPLPLVRVELPQNRGRAAAANAGIAAASGEWIAFLDDDDRVEPEHFATLAGLATGCGHRAVYTDAAVTVWEPDAAGGWSCVERRLPYSRDFDRERLLVDNYIPFHTLLVERSLVAEAGELDGALPFFEDWDFLIRLAVRAPFLHFARVTCEYRHFRGSGHQILGERASEHGDFLRRKAQVLEKHAALLTPEVLAAIVDVLRAEAVRAGGAVEAAERERRRHGEELGQRIAELGDESQALRLELERRDDRLRATYAEIERLTALIRAMEATRAWRTHRWLEGVRGR